MEIGRELYRGKAKVVYETSDPGLVLMRFTDQATAFDGAKKGFIRDKGEVNAKVSAALFEQLGEEGIPTHFVRMYDDASMVVRRLEIIKVEVVVRNIAAGSISKRLGFAEGIPFAEPILELYYKNDELHDPLINEWHVRALGLAEDRELKFMESTAFRVNDVLRRFFERHELLLVDFKLEFGRHDGKVLLGDEISPDTCRLWDVSTGEKLDKDRFRRDLGNVEAAYLEVLRRVSARP